MGSLGAPSDVHIIMAAVPGYGHVRPLRSLARSLTKTGHSITFCTSDAFEESLSAIAGVEFVSYKGIANWGPDTMNEYFPERASLPQDPRRVVWDLEHVFFGGLSEQFAAINSVLARPELQRKQVVVVADASVTGLLPVVLEGKGVRRVPVIAVANFPFLSLSKDTAPFGMGLPSQDEEKNRELNAQVTAMFGPAHEACKRILSPYACAKPLPSEFPLDNLHLTPDLYLQLCIPDMELPRTDLPPNTRLVGTLLGANDKKGEPEWYNDFVVDDNRPLVVVTSGTIPGIDPQELIIPTLEACKDLPVRVVACAVFVEMGDYELPANARVAEWIPFEDLFTYTSLVVSNGGYGGINQAFANGIPMIVAGMTEDKIETSMRAERTGAAINLRTQTPSIVQLRDAVEKILADGTYKQRALELKEKYAEYDAIGSVVKAIDEIVEKFYDVDGGVKGR